ncbi:MAG: SPOR domain-containing protein [Notoacmeibacter sp.]|nr:SPOR domain-containing protein [Notoacmeibacter sp.]
MADGNSFKLEEDLNLSEDDPMAELTRIMGFPPKAAPVSSSEPDDFALDLEGEMISGDEFSPPRSSGFDISALRAPQGVPASPVEPVPTMPPVEADFDIPDLGDMSEELADLVPEVIDEAVEGDTFVSNDVPAGALEDEFADAFADAFAADDTAVSETPLVAETPEWHREPEPAVEAWSSDVQSGIDMDFGDEVAGEGAFEVETLAGSHDVPLEDVDAGAYEASVQDAGDAFAVNADMAMDDVLSEMDLPPLAVHEEPVQEATGFADEMVEAGATAEDVWSAGEPAAALFPELEPEMPSEGTPALQADWAADRQVAESWPPVADEGPVPSPQPAPLSFEDNGIEDELTALLEGRTPPAPEEAQPSFEAEENWRGEQGIGETDAAMYDMGQPLFDTDAERKVAVAEEAIADLGAVGPEVDDIQLDLGDFDEEAFLDQAFDADDLAPGDEMLESVAAADFPASEPDALDAGAADLDPELLAGIEAAANGAWDDEAGTADSYDTSIDPVGFATEDDEAQGYAAKESNDTFAAKGIGAVAGIAAAGAATVSAAGGVTSGFLSRFTRKDVPETAQAEMPEIDTTDVPDAGIAAVDDLDIPAYDYEQDTVPQASTDYDDLALDAFGTQQATQPELADDGFDPQFDTYFDEQLALRSGEPGFETASAQPIDAAADAAAYRNVAYATQEPATASAVDAALDRDLSAGLEPEYAEPRRSNRGMMIAAIVAGVALVGGIGAFAFSSGGDRAEDGTAVVLADKTPVKVKPENPGGAEVPNQDKKVYEQVAGKAVTETPEQKTLVSKSEEPVDVSRQNVRVVAPGLNEEASAKSDARIDPATASEPEQTPEVAAVAPRRVKTFIVRPDGTLVANEAPEPQAAIEKPVEVAKAEPAPAPKPTAAPKIEEPAALTPVAKAEPKPEPKAPAAKPVQTTTIKRPAQPEAVPVVPSRPAEQPVNIVGTTRQANTPAAAAPAQQVASSPAWVQIASQPSRELAQTSYRNALARFGSIINGKGVNIAAADIPGRGTFHRVNIPAASFNEAVAMCKRIKAAGGDCLPKR